VGAEGATGEIYADFPEDDQDCQPYSVQKPRRRWLDEILGAELDRPATT